MSSDEKKQQPEAKIDGPFPAKGQVMAVRPSRLTQLPPINSKDHLKFRVLVHGFHCKDSANAVNRAKVTSPGEGETQAEIFAWHTLGDKGRWVPAPQRTLDAFNSMPSDDAIMGAIGTPTTAAFDHPTDWGKKGRCQHGDCLYIILLVWAPKEMFAMDARSRQPMSAARE